MATAVLVILVFALARTCTRPQIATAVGAYIGATYWFTSSTSFANPAITIGRTLTDSFAGIAPESAPALIGSQLAGGSLGVLLARILFFLRTQRKGNDDHFFRTTQHPVRLPCQCWTKRDGTPAGRALRGLLHRRALRWIRAGRSGASGNCRRSRSDGIDASSETPKGFDLQARYTAVITMGCGESCPFYPGAFYEDWLVDDPKNQGPEAVSHIIADIDNRVRRLIARLVPGIGLPASVGLGGTHYSEAMEGMTEK